MPPNVYLSNVSDRHSHRSSYHDYDDDDDVDHFHRYLWCLMPNLDAFSYMTTLHAYTNNFSMQTPFHIVHKCTVWSMNGFVHELEDCCYIFFLKKFNFCVH